MLGFDGLEEHLRALDAALPVGKQLEVLRNQLLPAPGGVYDDDRTLVIIGWNRL